MLAASRRPHNPNRKTDDIGWDSGDLSSFLTGVDINAKCLFKDDITMSNKSIKYFQTAPKRVLVAEIIRTFNHNQLNLLNGIFHIQKCNDRLINDTKNRNKTYIQLNNKIKHLATRQNTLFSLLFKAMHPLPITNDIIDADLIDGINEPIITPLKQSQSHAIPLVQMDIHPSKQTQLSNTSIIEQNKIDIKFQEKKTTETKSIDLQSEPSQAMTTELNDKINNKINNKITVKSSSADYSVSALNKNIIEISNLCITPSPESSHGIVCENPRVINNTNTQLQSQQPNHKLIINPIEQTTEQITPITCASPNLCADIHNQKEKKLFPLDSSVILDTSINEKKNTNKINSKANVKSSSTEFVPSRKKNKLLNKTQINYNLIQSKKKKTKNNNNNKQKIKNKIKKHQKNKRKSKIIKINKNKLKNKQNHLNCSKKDENQNNNQLFKFKKEEIENFIINHEFSQDKYDDWIDYKMNVRELSAKEYYEMINGTISVKLFKQWFDAYHKHD